MSLYVFLYLWYCLRERCRGRLLLGNDLGVKNILLLVYDSRRLCMISSTQIESWGLLWEHFFQVVVSVHFWSKFRRIRFNFSLYSKNVFPLWLMSRHSRNATCPLQLRGMTRLLLFLVFFFHGVLTLLVIMCFFLGGEPYIRVVYWFQSLCFDYKIYMFTNPTFLKFCWADFL